MNRLVEGVINVVCVPMVASTDFATPVSNLSNILNVSLYGTVAGNSTVFLVAAGTGSLAASNRDFTHIGPSATGLYAVRIGPAEMSDLSNAIYDQLILHASATGAARQTMIFSVVRHTISDVFSTMNSQFTVLNTAASNAYSAAVLANAAASNAYSAIIIVQSNVSAMSAFLSDAISDLQSDLRSFVAGRSQLSDLISDLRSFVAGRSQLSDLHSDLKSYLLGMSGMLSDVDSALTSRFSDLMSRITTTGVSLTSDTMSNIRSAITAAGGGAGATPSALWAYGYSNLTVASSIGSLFRGRLSTVSAIYSGISNLQSRIDSTVASRSQLSDLASDLRSFITADLYSQLSDFRSDLLSLLATTGVTLTSDMQSNLRSAITAAGGGGGATPSALWAYGYSNLTASSSIGSALRARLSSISVIESRIPDITTTGSDLVSAIWAHAVASDLVSKVSDLRSRMIVANSAFSNYLSNLSGMSSDIRSSVSDLISDIRSLLTSASWLSDVASHVWTAKYTALNGPSAFGSLIRNRMSTVSAIYSGISNLQSRVDSTVASRSQISDLVSDLRSFVAGRSQLSDLVSDIRSLATVTGVGLNLATVSDLKSAINAAGGGGGTTASQVWGYDYGLLTGTPLSSIGSLIRLRLSTISGIYSGISNLQSRIDSTVASRSQVSDLLSDLRSFVAGRSQLSDLISDLRSLATVTGVGLNTATVSDLKSAINAAGGGGGTTASQVWAFDYGTATVLSSMGSLLRGRMSTVSAIYSGISNLQSRIDSTVASRSQVSDLLSDMRSLVTVTGVGLNTTTLSDLTSKVWTHAVASDLVSKVSDLRSRMLVTNSAFSNYLSNLSAMVSDVDSALTSRFSDLMSRITTTGVSLTAETLSDIRSAIAAGALTSDTMSDIAVAVWNEHWAGHLGASTFGSATMRGVSAASDAASAAQQANTRASQIYDLLSDVESQLDATTATLSDFYSDFQSRVPSIVMTRTQTMTELTGVPAASPNAEQALMFLYMAQRNRTRRNATSVTIENDAQVVIASAFVDFDGSASVFSRGEFA